MRDYEQRFARLEEALKKESHDLRESTRHHLETLEGFVHKELVALEGRLNVEREERSESHSRLAADLSAAPWPAQGASRGPRQTPRGARLEGAELHKPKAWKRAGLTAAHALAEPGIKRGRFWKRAGEREDRMAS